MTKYLWYGLGPRPADFGPPKTNPPAEKPRSPQVTEPPPPVEKPPTVTVPPAPSPVEKSPTVTVPPAQSSIEKPPKPPVQPPPPPPPIENEPVLVLKVRNRTKEIHASESPVSINTQFCEGWVNNASFLSYKAQFVVEWDGSNWVIKPGEMCDQPNFVNGEQLSSAKVLHEKDFISIGGSRGGYVEFTVSFQ